MGEQELFTLAKAIAIVVIIGRAVASLRGAISLAIALTLRWRFSCGITRKNTGNGLGHGPYQPRGLES
ncbi:MAG TPA: hypothetical protein VG164_08910 [Trebonia sp.]|nr:hypothetical protein [Trebonia sp.]